MKCPHCGKVPYPAKNEDGTWNWKNVFRIDWFSILIIGIILFSAWAYKHDTAQCFDILESPEDYCNDYCSYRINISGNLDPDNTINWEELARGAG